VLDAIRDVARIVGFDDRGTDRHQDPGTVPAKQRTRLFDLWLAVEQAGIKPSAIAECFGPYRPDGWTIARAHDNLATKLHDATFTTDLELLVAQWPAGNQVDTGAAMARAVIAGIAARCRRPVRRDACWLSGESPTVARGPSGC
jgi:hypothetical protein